jgi:hypothetical protein
MNFQYSQMYKFYRNFGDATNDAFAHMYEAVKYNKATETTRGPSAPFVERSMQVRRIPTEDKLDSPTGTFLVFRAEDNDACKRLYVVQPQMYKDFGIFTADHYSFHFNKGVAEDIRLQLHKTYYTPVPDLPTTGFRNSTDNFLPACFGMPKDVEKFKDEFLHNDVFKVKGQYLYDLMTRPMTEPRVISFTVGGAGGRRTRRVTTFEDMWTALPIKRILVVGVRNGDGFDVTVFVFPTLRPAESHSMFLRSDVERDFRADIARHYRTYTWEDFRWHPDPADDFGDPEDKDEPESA